MEDYIRASKIAGPWYFFKCDRIQMEQEHRKSGQYMPIYHFTRVSNLYSWQRHKICGLSQMNAFYGAIWLPSYGMKKDGLQNSSQREVTQKLRKGEQSFYCRRPTVWTS